MRAFGYELTIQKAHTTTTVADSRGGWWPWIREPFAGAWQRNREWSTDSVLPHPAVYACVSRISQDVGKLRPKLVQQARTTGIWSEIDSGTYSPTLRRPNHFQNHIQFKEHWISSKLIRGNAYVLKVRGGPVVQGKRVVTALYVLDPTRVEVLVAPGGEIFYQLQADNLSDLDDAVTVPASEIIHDRMNALFHPLVGVSPIFAAGMAAHIGTTIQSNSAEFFAHGSNQSGVLTVPTSISPEKAKELGEKWNAGYSGANSGKVAVLGDNMKFTPLTMSAVDAQMIEQLRWSSETVASVFHVPAFKIGIGQMPTYQNGEILNQIYYSDCLQSHIESMEVCLDEGLDLMQFGTLGVELDLDGLLRMDTASLIRTLAEGVTGGIYSPNEARGKVDLAPKPGGESPYLQQQNYSLAALAKRDARDDPFGTGGSEPPAPVPEKDRARSIALAHGSFKIKAAA